jgi:molybdate transport repressor ModE-like protein
MRIIPTLAWRLENESGRPLDPRLLPLLQEIATLKSLSAAVVACGISYRAAWGLLRDYEGELGVPLVRLERGRGARLDAAGESLLRAQAGATQRLARVLPALAVDLGADKAAKPRRTTVGVRVAASHDLCLAALRDALPASARLRIDISFVGSLGALRLFAEGQADAGGFHLPEQARRGKARDLAPFLRWLRPRRDRLLRFADREQGLIVPHGNPQRIRGVQDIARKHLRFVNRQRGSGTRLLIDRILAEQNLTSASVNGYANEEFTHAAVAATIAAGAADAGFGLRAAASEYGLAFVPQLRERYYLAVRAADLESPPVARLIEVLRSPLFARLARRLPGYDATAAGTVLGIEALG